MTMAVRHLWVGLRTLLVLTLVLIPLPFLLPPASQAVAVRVLIFAIMAVGWNVMSGFGGMFSFGHAAYFGLGAYTAGYLLVEHDVQLVMRVCDRIHVLDFGAILAVGTPAEIQQDQLVLDAYLGSPVEAGG